MSGITWKKEVVKEHSIINERAEYFGKQNNWKLFLSEHAIERGNMRAIAKADIEFNLSLFLDMIQDYGLEADIIKYSNASNKEAIEKIGWREQNIVQFRDDVNDTNYILAFFPKVHEMHVVTCWNQRLDREVYGKKHANLKRNSFAIILNNKLIAANIIDDFGNPEPIFAINIDSSEYKIFD